MNDNELRLEMPDQTGIDTAVKNAVVHYKVEQGMTEPEDALALYNLADHIRFAGHHLTPEGMVDDLRNAVFALMTEMRVDDVLGGGSELIKRFVPHLIGELVINPTFKGLALEYLDSFSKK